MSLVKYMTTSRHVMTQKEMMDGSHIESRHTHESCHTYDHDVSSNVTVRAASCHTHESRHTH